jgi:hypothetical protein
MMKKVIKQRASVLVIIVSFCLSACIPCFAFAAGEDSTGSGITQPLSQADKNTNTLNTLKGRGIPVLRIGDTQIPIRSNGLFNTWALLNLILAIPELIGAFAMIIVTLYRASTTTGKHRCEYQTFDNGDAGNGYIIAEEHTESESLSRSIICTFFAAIIAVISMLLFIIAEDTQTLMVLTDDLSVTTFIFFIFEVVLIVIALRRSTKRTATEMKPNR